VSWYANVCGRMWMYVDVCAGSLEFVIDGRIVSCVGA